MNLFDWGRGETWNWQRRLLAWEEELAGEYCALLNYFVFQANVDDKLLWLSHEFKKYSVSSSYSYLLSVDHNTI